MQITRSTLALPALGLALWVGVHGISTGTREVAVLRSFDLQGQDRFTTLWVVDDPHGFAWVRANRPDRKWLAQVGENPSVDLRRGRVSKPYRARIFDDPQSRAYVTSLFRQKYGMADRVRAWRSGNDTIPVRLEARRSADAG